VPGLKLEKDVIKRLRSNATLHLPGLFTTKINSGMYTGNLGIPDLIFLWEGKALFLEAKSGSNLTTNQRVVITQMRATKTNVWVVRPILFPCFSFKTIIPTGYVLEVQYDITHPETWQDLFKGPDRKLAEFTGVVTVQPGELR
jgi:hypothetical protein